MDEKPLNLKSWVSYLAVKFRFTPGLILPFETWERVRCKGTEPGWQERWSPNLVTVKLTNPADQAAMAQRIRIAGGQG